MSVKLEKLENSMAKLTIEVSKEDFEAAVEKAYQKNKNKINLPGFRKGKAPRKMIEQMYGKEVFYEDAANEVIPSSYDKAVSECKEEIVSNPKIEVVSIGADKPFIFTAEVALKPEVSLGKYKGVKVDKFEAKVTAADVDAELKKQQENNARTIDVTDRAVEMGDMTIIDFEGFVDGVAFQGGKGTDYPLTIGSGAFIPGFEDALVGAKIGELTDVKVKFPKDYQAAELAGKPAVFKCTVKSIKAKELPELNDEFASDVSEFDTLKEYKDDIKAKLLAKKTEEALANKEDAVIDAVIADADMKLPEAMIDTQARQIVEDFAQRLQAQGLSMDQYMKFSGSTMDQLLEDVRPQAIRRIQSRLILEAVAKAEKITCSADEFKSEVKILAEAYQMEEAKVKELLGKKGEEQVKEDVCIKKAITFLVENAKEEASAKKATKAADATEEKAPAKKTTTAKKTATKKADEETAEAPKKAPAKKTTTTKKAASTDTEKKPAAKKTTTKKAAEEK